MTHPALAKLVSAPAPGFLCSAAGDRSGKQFLARIEHVLRRPASRADLEKIRKLLGEHAGQVVAFYQEHNGFELYRDTRSETAGIELLPVGKWRRATADMREWFGELADDPENDPDRIATGIAIATVPQSGNYFVMPVEGPSAGQIFYADHDDWYEAAFAEDFNGFVARVCRDPVELLSEDLGCYARYSDGKTDAQWIPEKYFADVAKAPKK